MDYLDEISRITRDIVWGNADRVKSLFQYTHDPSVPPEVARLAEIIATLVVQKEVREYQLEQLIEQLFSTRTALVQARHDAMTGLPNRAMFEETLGKACGSADAFSTSLSLMLIDLDRFKFINDTYGHAAGDELLLEVAERLKKIVGEDGMIGRMGGDEFAVLFINILPEAKVLQFGEAILADIASPFVLGDQVVNIGASIGVAFRSLGETPARLLKNADVAMYRAKGTGRGKLFRYTVSAFIAADPQN